MAKQHPKQVTLTAEHYGELFLPPSEQGYSEAVVVRTVEEGELLAYKEAVGREPRNFEPGHPGYKQWTWKNKRQGNVLDLFPNERT